MKKNIILIVFAIIVLFPLGVCAKEKEYTSKNFEEILKEEQIEKKFSDYQETDDQAIIYLFRGSGCAYCRAFIEYLNSITDEYGKYFKVVSYEVWNNSENSKLLEKVSEFTNQAASGVPYIVIGEKVFKGYSETYNDDIKDAIKKQYDSKNSYDVLKEMQKNTNSDENVKSNTAVILICNLIFIAVATVVIIVFNYSNNQNLVAEIEELKEVINTKTKSSSK